MHAEARIDRTVGDPPEMMTRISVWLLACLLSQFGLGEDDSPALVFDEGGAIRDIHDSGSAPLRYPGPDP